MKKWFKRFLYPAIILFVLLNIICASQAYYFTHFFRDIKPGTVAPSVWQMLMGAAVPKSTVTDSLSINHSSVSFKTKSGLKLAAWYLNHQSNKDSMNAKGTVLMFHGYGSCRSGIISEATAFYKMGYDVLMTDFRAHGESDGDASTIGYTETEDVKLAWDFIKATGQKNIILWGVSMGAATVTKTLHDYSDVQPSKIILEMPYGTMVEAAEGMLRNMQAPQEPFGNLLIFWGGAEQSYWAYSMKPVDYAKSISCPVLQQIGAKDIRVTEKESEEIFANISSSQKKLIVYTECGHESIYAKEQSKWLATVTSFLQQ
jgi:uncharacterized protein